MPARDRIRIMTVDDQPIFREVARALVDRLPGFEVVAESADADGALRAAPDADPDMVLVDVRMRGKDGIEAARELTAQDPSRVIVLVSSADVRDFSVLAESSGAAALVHKHWLSPALLRGLWVAHRRR